MSDLIRIREVVQPGQSRSAEALLPLVYAELRKLASAKMALQPPGHTLQATAFVHEAWLKLTGNSQACWYDREHFFRAAAEAMRQILVDRARAHGRVKRGANPNRVNLDEVDLATEASPEALLLAEEALARLEREDARKAELVKLRFYAGLSVQQTAQALAVSEKTVKRHLLHACAWLFPCQLKSSRPIFDRLAKAVHQLAL